MIEPRRAPVRPRVFSPHSGEVLLLEDEVRAVLETARSGSIFISGAPGSGKTTALEHLAFVLPNAAAIRFVDRTDYGEVLRAEKTGWIVCSSAEAADGKNWFRLAPWGADEWLEYLLASHKDRCASVLSRLRTAQGNDFFEGSPELWRVVLDTMAADETLSTPRQVLDRFLRDLLNASPARWKHRVWALSNLLRTPYFAELEPDQTTVEANTRFRYLRHRPVQLLLGASQILDDIQKDQRPGYFERSFPRELVREAAQACRLQPRAVDILRSWLITRPGHHAMAASILHAAGAGWVPEPGSRPQLVGAYLEGVSWAKAVLSEADLSGADLSGADLRSAYLERVKATATDLRLANMHGAFLLRFVAKDAHLEHADLTKVEAEEADFEDALLDGANLSDAKLEDASLTGCSLVAADLTRANLKGATLSGANLTQACLVDAKLEGAILSAAKLEDTNLMGASFEGARLDGCNLEDISLPGADFRKASLQDVLLTGSSMPDARFDGACFHGAGLAEIDWERASLRGADLRGVSFHLGSSRSGRVGSPIACEGSRMGFYTDDYNEQDFKSPEEIRKANLCFADLRGARIDDVDFYLVDLRHALFDPEQEQHLRRCGAILEARGG